MWIAKPLEFLTPTEKEHWQRIEHQKAPLSQTLNWARAAEHFSVKSYLVFSPDEEVGGLVFCDSHPSLSDLHFECVNGPLLHWDRPDVIARQVATFAIAVARLDPRFSSLSLKPRWEAGLIEKRMPYLPLEIQHRTQAATLTVSTERPESELFKSFSPRLQRTLRTTGKHPIETQWERVTPINLGSFVPHLQEFGRSREFKVPPLEWFMTLTQDSENSNPRFPSPQFWLASASYLSSKTQILVSTLGNRASYLFGFQKRPVELRAAISPSAAVHWEALKRCISMGISTYDLNGTIKSVGDTNSYAGVCRFKEQFRGKLIQYDVPEFLIEL